MTQKLFESVDEYINDLLVDEDDALIATETSIREAHIPQISISANQGKFLQILAKLCNAKKILEMGTLGGYSTIWMARALPKDGKLITLEIDKKHSEVAQQNFNRCGLASTIEIRLGKAIELLPQLQAEGAGPFD